MASKEILVAKLFVKSRGSVRDNALKRWNFIASQGVVDVREFVKELWRLKLMQMVLLDKMAAKQGKFWDRSRNFMA